MKITNLPIQFEKAREVLKKITTAGYEAYFVGGCVRDTLLGQPIHDIDIATSAFPAEIKEIFPKTIDIGIEHGTVLVLDQGEQFEVTTFRTESGYQDFRRPDKVAFVRSLEEDLKRRDFTINAFALEENGTVVDLFDGLLDLQKSMLRAVGIPQERFHEDALRMMRGLRFISQLGFELETETCEAISANHQLLEKISIERIRVEFMKLLLGRHRKPALEKLVETECYLYCPGLKDYGEALLRFSDLPEKPVSDEVSAWTLLIDQLGLAENQVRPFLKKWKCSNETIAKTQACYHGLIKRKKNIFSDWLLYQLGDTTVDLIEELLFYSQLPKDQSWEKRYKALPIHSLKDLAINGNDLMNHCQRKAGKWLKSMLLSTEQAVIERKVENQQEQLLAFVTKELQKEAYDEV